MMHVSSCACYLVCYALCDAIVCVFMCMHVIAHVLMSTHVLMCKYVLMCDTSISPLASRRSRLKRYTRASEAIHIAGIQQ